LYYTTFSTFLGRPGIWLEDLFVRPQYRDQGHGLALLQRLRAQTDGRVEWAVLDWNQPSIDFYRQLGASRSRAGPGIGGDTYPDRPWQSSMWPAMWQT
jgi:GNAT superfamily N-acetyltransferase